MMVTFINCFLATWISNIIESVQYIFSCLMEIIFKKQKCVNTDTKKFSTNVRAPTV